MLPATLRSPWAWLPPAIALALVVAIHVSGANRALFLWLNHGGHIAGDVAWFHLTMLGDGAVALTLVLPCIRRAPHLFWPALVAAMVAGLWTQVTKQLIDVPRPLTVFGEGAFHLAGPAFRHVSFPSGHAAAAAALAGIWILGVDGHALWRAALLGLAGLVGLSRIMVGVHWPLDVLWGMLGGWLGAWCGLALQARRRWHTAGRGGMAAGAVLMAVAASLLVSHHIGMPAVMPAQRILATVCLVWGAWELRGLTRLRAAAAPVPGGAAPYAAHAPPWVTGRARASWATLLAGTWRWLHPSRLRWRAGRMHRRRRDG
jgi:membrane-associated phospholipid phosphatase